MPDPVSNMFQTILLVLYFITPAETVHLKGGQKQKEAFEKTKIWTLQSTSQIPTENPNMCVANGKFLLQKFEQVSTITVKLYCLCPAHPTDPNDICDKAKKKNIDLFKRGESLPPPAAVVPIDSDTPMPLLPPASNQ